MMTTEEHAALASLHTIGRGIITIDGGDLGCEYDLDAFNGYFLVNGPLPGTCNGVVYRDVVIDEVKRRYYTDRGADIASNARTVWIAPGPHQLEFYDRSRVEVLS